MVPDKSVSYNPTTIIVHLLERHHDDRFGSLMGQFLHQWRQYREKLNHTPLAQETREY